MDSQNQSNNSEDFQALADSIQNTTDAAAPFAGPYAPIVLGVGTALASAVTWFARGNKAEREKQEEHNRTWEEAKKEYTKPDKK